MKLPCSPAPARRSWPCLADPTRLAVVEVLLAGPRNVKEINRHLESRRICFRIICASCAKPSSSPPAAMAKR